MTARDVICLSSIDWDFIWQGHQEIMASLARQGSRVLFVENTGVRSPALRDLPRLRQRLRNWLRGVKGFRQERPNLFVYSPLLLPFPYARLARRVNRVLLLRAIQRWMRAVDFHQPVIWTFLPTPLALEMIRALEPILTVYYCIDDLASSSAQARRIVPSEERLMREADLVFVTSARLAERAARFRRDVHLFPFGVDSETFERIRQGSDDVARELRGLSHPVVGYVGGIHRWVDQGLIASAAARMPDTSFVLVGPAQTETSRLSRCPNVHLLGGRPHEAMPSYVKGFDVGIVPYRLSDYTAHVYPTKLNEYLAMGLPVVSTDLREIRRFNADHGEVVAIARSPEEFVRALRDAARPAPPDVVRRRIEISRQNSWTTRIAQMGALIEAQLSRREASRPSWQESLGRLYRTARRRALQAAAGAAALYLMLFHTPFLWMVASPLRAADEPRGADAVVVFAGGVGESGEAGGGYQERVKQAVDLYQAGHAPILIFSSGFLFVFREAEVMRELAVHLGVPDSAIILETKAANTHENVRLVKAILDERRWRSVLLVSSPYHMRRALLTWRKVAPGVQVIPTPAARSQFYSHSRGASLGQIQGILHEYLGIVYYWWKGWI